MASSVPKEVLLAFHTMEREIFRRLVMEMARDPFRSMQMIALWLWIERLGFPNLIQKMLALPARILNLVADEAEECLKCLHLDLLPLPPTSQDSIPITRSLAAPPLSLQFLHERRQGAISGMKTIMDDVCSRIFDDIVERLAQRMRAAIFAPGPVRPNARPGMNVGPLMPPPDLSTNVGQMRGPRNPIIPHQEGTSRQGGTIEAAEMMMMMMGPRFRPFFNPGPHHVGSLDGPHAFAGGAQVPQMQIDPLQNLVGEPQEWGVDIINAFMAEPNLNPRARPWAPEDEASQGDRTMFLTFSRGYPLSEAEIVEFFTRHWGDCIQSLFIQETEEGVQPLFARLVLYSPATVPLILQGQEKAKFVIKGKHVWVRPYVPKKSRAQSPAK
ncbi:hypothetical protein AAC387_Pa02g0210 [Persea americana]